MRLPTDAEVVAATECIITRAFRTASLDWRREMTLCMFYAAQENVVLRVDHVWEVFFRRGSGLQHRKAYGMGRIMRIGLDFGWIKPIIKPHGTPRTRANHNDRGTLTYQSTIYNPDARSINSAKSYQGIGTLQEEFPFMLGASA